MKKAEMEQMVKELQEQNKFLNGRLELARTEYRKILVENKLLRNGGESPIFSIEGVRCFGIKNMWLFQDSGSKKVGALEWYIAPGVSTRKWSIFKDEEGEWTVEAPADPPKEGYKSWYPTFGFESPKVKREFSVKLGEYAQQWAEDNHAKVVIVSKIKS